MKCHSCSTMNQSGNYCSNCGNTLTKASKLQQRIKTLERAIDYYLECEGKKNAGSTIQYDSSILYKALWN